jgi:hypothetical protein
MRCFLSKALIGSGLLLFGLVAQAQYGPRYGGDYPNYGQREAREHGWIFDRVRGDLDRAEASTLPFSGDRNRIERARVELNELQSSWNAGENNWREFNEAVTALQRVMDVNRMSDRTRDFLAGDLNRLRDMRSRLDIESR